MHLVDLFEDNRSFDTKDPKTQQALARAKMKYHGIANDDMDAFVMAISDEQEEQDGQIDSQFDVNSDQEEEISDNDIEIMKLKQRLQALEQGMTTETESLEEGPLDYIGRKLKIKTTDSRPTGKEAPDWAHFMAQTAEGAWHWLSNKSDIVGNSDSYFPDAGKTEFSGFVSSPNGWQHSLMPVNDHNEYIGENKKDHPNFTADDLNELNVIRDLPTLKQRAFQLLSNPTSGHPMKPEKVEWFKQALKQKANPASVIKLMWDLLLSGEGNAVKGSRFSTDKNSYRSTFG